MGRTRSSASDSERLTHLRLEIKAPSLFRCPISLEVMRSPVSLVTGVTYDRRSIQRWLDSGNTTCPATMLPLPTTDLVPNLTLRRLIDVWSAAGKPNGDSVIAEEDTPLMHLEKLAAFFANPDVDDAVKNGIAIARDFLGIVVSAVGSRDGGGELNLEMVEAATEIVSTILSSVCIEAGNKERLVSALCSDLDSIVESLAAALRDGRELKSRTNSARIMQAILSSSTAETKVLTPEKLDALVPGLIQLINSNCPSAIDEGLGCLMELLQSKQALKLMVRSELVPSLVRILSLESITISSRAAEQAIMMLEATTNCAAGRAVISEMVEDCVRAVMGRMMKVGKEGREAAVELLWGFCYGSLANWKGKEAVAVSGGMAKILIVMQGDCSPVTRKMSGDLLRVFRVDTKNLVAGYDTETTHIMPF